MSLSTRLAQAATVSDEPPEAVGGGDEWVNGFLLTAMNKKRQSENVRGSIRCTLPDMLYQKMPDKTQGK